MFAQRPDYGPFISGGRITGCGATLAFLGVIILFAARQSADARKIALIVVAVGLLPMMIGLARFFWARHAVGRADLTLDDPIPIGFSGTAIYYRPLRGAELKAIEARLQCDEEIQRGKGKNTTLTRKTVYDETLSPVVLPTSTRIEVQVPFRIPAAGPASFDCGAARTQWFIRFRLKMARCPNVGSSFMITVAPAVLR